MYFKLLNYKLAISEIVRWLFMKCGNRHFIPDLSASDINILMHCDYYLYCIVIYLCIVITIFTYAL